MCEKQKRYSDEELDFFRSVLIEKIKDNTNDTALLKSIDKGMSSSEASGEYTTYSYHIADQGTDAQEKEKRYFFLGREQAYLKKLIRALERIDAKTYGVCASCKVLIPKGRLEIVPVARYCVPCKEKIESGQMDEIPEGSF